MGLTKKVFVDDRSHRAPVFAKDLNAIQDAILAVEAAIAGGGGGGGTATRATATATTVSLAPGATDTTTPITLAKGYVLYSIATSRPARVTLYETAAAMSADASRGAGTDPAAGAGVVLDYVTVATTPYTLGPLVTGANMETTPSSSISMRVTNNDTSTGAVTVTLVWLKVE